VSLGRHAAAAILAGVMLAMPAHIPHARTLTGGDQLSAVYAQILNTRFDRAEETLATACGPAPREACQVLEATTTWWRILINPDDTSLDDEFQQRVSAAIAATERWTERRPESAEAWFYLGGAYGARVSWRVQRKEHMAAARDGKRIKEALERALELDADLSDARFGIGLYKYYAAIAPAFARFFRFLFLLPGGNREEGLIDMEAVHARGVLLRGEADYQLHWIYLWYEHQPGRALDLLRTLAAQYPANPHFVERIAETEGGYLHDHAASLKTWQTMVDRAPQMGDPRLAATMGRMGSARMLDALYETDRAVEALHQVIDSAPSAPFGVVAEAQLKLGQMTDRLGDRAAAVLAYNAALNAVPAEDPHEIAAAARAGIRRPPPDAAAAQAYRLSLTGWRAFERGALEQAARALAGAATAAPGDAMIRVRLACVRAARKETEPALAEFDRIIAMGAQAPPAALGSAYLWSAALLEQQGRRDIALARYRAVGRIFGTDSRLTAAAAKAIARLSH
jgi:predicted negative regulator of RcsB-dependent stress response